MNLRPIIGITSGFLPEDSQRKEPTSKAMDYQKSEYSEIIYRSGGIPFLLPNIIDNAENITDIIDGLLLAGGYDIDPQYYGESVEYPMKFYKKRDDFEMELIKHFNGPILGICRGLQILNVFYGGTLYQDLKGQKDDAVEHGSPDKKSFHNVDIESDSILCKIISKNEISVNSSHHQGIKKLSDKFEAVAKTEDGLIEAIEHKENDIIAVQWHPETDTDNVSIALFKHFINLSITYKNKKVVSMESKGTE